MDAGGDPVPSPSVVARLQQLSPRFGLRWVNGPLGYFALTVRWAEGDPRWEHVRTGALPEHMAFDIEHTFPRSVAVDEIASYVEARWGERGRVTGGEAVKEARNIVQAARDRQQSATDSAVERVHHQSVERHERESRHDLRVAAGVDRPTPMSGAKFGKGRRTA